MSLDFYVQTAEKYTEKCHCLDCGNQHEKGPFAKTLFDANITHNLGEMFGEAGVYEILWHGDGMRAGDVIQKLKDARDWMQLEPARFKKHDAPNGWGLYEHALSFIDTVIKGCEENPDGIIYCSR